MVTISRLCDWKLLGTFWLILMQPCFAYIRSRLLLVEKVHRDNTRNHQTFSINMQRITLGVIDDSTNGNSMSTTGDHLFDLPYNEAYICSENCLRNQKEEPKGSSTIIDIHWHLYMTITQQDRQCGTGVNPNPGLVRTKHIWWTGEG